MNTNKRLKTVHVNSNATVPNDRRLSIAQLIRNVSRKYARIDPFSNDHFRFGCERSEQVFAIVTSKLGILEQCILCMVSKAMAILVASPYKETCKQSFMCTSVPITTRYKTLLEDTLANYTHTEVAEQVQCSPLWSHFYTFLFERLNIVGVFSEFSTEESLLCNDLIKAHFTRKLRHKNLLFYCLAQTDGTIRIHYQLPTSVILNDVRVTIYALCNERLNNTFYCDNIGDCIEEHSKKQDKNLFGIIDIDSSDYLEYHEDIILVYFSITYHALDLCTQTISKETVFSNMVQDPFYKHPYFIAI